MKPQKTLIAGPYIGELGWEIFTWQPMIRHIWLDHDCINTIIYTGPGRKLFYRFAAEVRTLPNMPVHEAECMAWHDMPRYVNDFKRIISQVERVGKEEFKGNVAIFSPAHLKKLNDLALEKGFPDLFYGDPIRAEELLPGVEGAVVLCVRDRAMSDFRNWPYARWGELATTLLPHAPVVLVGQVRDRVAWSQAMPIGVIDLTGRTTLDDFICVMGKTRLAVGGSSGALHLASRCGVDHLVWGAQHAASRYLETNWFGADFQYRANDGWLPAVEDIANAVKGYLEKGEF